MLSPSVGQLFPASSLIRLEISNNRRDKGEGKRTSQARSSKGLTVCLGHPCPVTLQTDSGGAGTKCEAQDGLISTQPTCL